MKHIIAFIIISILIVFGSRYVVLNYSPEGSVETIYYDAEGEVESSHKKQRNSYGDKVAMICFMSILAIVVTGVLWGWIYEKIHPDW